jgi:hypothetical protein
MGGRGGIVGEVRVRVGLLFDGLRLRLGTSGGGCGVADGEMLLRTTCMTRSLPRRSSAARVSWATLLAWSEACMSGLTRFLDDVDGTGGGGLRIEGSGLDPVEAD